MERDILLGKHLSCKSLFVPLRETSFKKNLVPLICCYRPIKLSSYIERGQILKNIITICDAITITPVF